MEGLASEMFAIKTCRSAIVFATCSVQCSICDRTSSMNESIFASKSSIFSCSALGFRPFTSVSPTHPSKY